ncbi:EAL domain-containing protein [Rahnella ecdela]|uniref:EAL domain-containing protein n=1 Tax=Rahnella ecdela TaxID=2816250 RepID=A0ABS6LNB7_9GAMM|nr:EAL domain-containing protein [Rahnella ecdela]MBU9848325.1 EAL domain-containing protein [Rahnella ecdela]
MNPLKAGGTDYIYQPIISFSGVILGFELVTGVSENRSDSECYESSLTPDEKVKAFYEQVTLAGMNENIFIDNDFLLSINIDYDIAVHIVDNPSMHKVLKRYSHIRLEIDDNFPEFRTGQERPVLQALSECCPLWLDNFGAGFTSLSLIMNEKFEYIKISKTFFWQHQGTISLRKIIEHLRPYCDGVIINGVENSQHIEYLSGSNILAMQGALWVPYSQGEFIQSFF